MARLPNSTRKPYYFALTFSLTGFMDGFVGGVTGSLMLLYC